MYVTAALDSILVLLLGWMVITAMSPQTDEIQNNEDPVLTDVRSVSSLERYRMLLICKDRLFLVVSDSRTVFSKESRAMIAMCAEQSNVYSVVSAVQCEQR